jgi:monoamine oxidase
MIRDHDRPTAPRALDRRQFLTLSSAGVAAAARSSFAFLPAQRPDGVVDVLIVGGGLAGLRAAQVLREAGRQVVILEARAVPGGRVQTLRAPFTENLHAEAGPIRIPGMHRRVLGLAQQYRLSMVPFASSGGAALVTIGGTSVRVPDELSKATAALGLGADEAGLAQGALLRKYVQNLPEDIATLTPTAASYGRWQAHDQVTWPDWLRARGASDGAVSLMTLGADSRQLSALYVLRQFAMLQNTDQFFKIEGGMDRLPRAIAGSLGGIIRYRSAVTKIEQTATTVRLDYQQNGRPASINGRQVIVTAPFSTLRRIEIRPPLPPSHTRAIETLPYFPAVRVLLQSGSRFWDDAGLTGAARTDQPAEIWDCTYDQPASSGILGATVGGAIGESLTAMPRPRAVRAGTDLVAKTFPQVRTQLRRSSIYRWAADPWSRGAFAVFRPGQMSAVMPEITRPEGRLHFAGEHTSSWMGWMEGALESGERAAQEVLSQ